MNIKSLKKTQTILILLVTLVFINSCNLIYIHKAKRGKLTLNEYKCFEPLASKQEKYTYKQYPFNVTTFQTNAYKFFSDNDTIVSIGARDGAFEFMTSFFLDSITFYLVDIDSSCLSQHKIDSIYLPRYSAIKKDIGYYNLYKKKHSIQRDHTKDSLFTQRMNMPVSCTYKFVLGTATSVDLDNNTANKVYINRTYHHFSNPDEMIIECNRILRPNGTLIIGDYVTAWNKKSWKHCLEGGNFKTERNFIKDIEALGFTLEAVYRGKKRWREFVFTKN